MTYLDNAATSFPKPKSVIKDVTDCIKNYCGNPGRSSHKLAITSASKIYDTRESISSFLGVDAPENVVFAQNATYALNTVIKGAITEKCHIITSDMEHNSVLRPIYTLCDKLGCELSFFDSSKPIDDAIHPLVRDDSKFLITTLTSNVTGRTLNIKELSDVSKRHNLNLILDASQYLGHKKLSLDNISYFALCSAGHKGLFGIQGSGFTVFKNKSIINTLAEGGSGFETFAHTMPELIPERYEAGTLSTPAIVSMYSGINYINSVEIDSIEEKLNTLGNGLNEILHEIPKVKIYGSSMGIVSFNISEIGSSRLAEQLNDENIAVRGGFHCAPIIHKKLGTDKTGTVRVSLSYFNNRRDLDRLYKALKKISRDMGLRHSAQNTSDK